MESPCDDGEFKESLFDNGEFKWGGAKRILSKERNYYKSFFWQNEEFHIHDCILVYDENEPFGHIAKIMKLWEEISTGAKMTQLRWFLRPSELPSHLHGQVACDSKELFLAFGKGKGVTNENRLDCISRKCKVLCTYKDVRNKQPSEDDLKDADYFFNRMYNVDRMKLSNLDVGVNILGCDVFFNKPEWVSGGRSQRLHDKNATTSTTTSSQPQNVQEMVAPSQAAEGGQSDVKSGLTGLDKAAEIQREAGKHEQKPKQDVTVPKRPNLVSDKGREKRAKAVHDEQKPVDEPAKGTIEALQPEAKSEGTRLEKDREGQEEKQQVSMPKRPNLTSSKGRGKQASALDVAELDQKNQASQRLGEGNTEVLQDFLATLRQSDQPVSRLKVKVSDAATLPHRQGISSEAPLTRARGALASPNAKLCGQENESSKKPWDANLEEGLPQERVLLIRNVDPSFTSTDIQDIMKSNFKGFLDARMVPGCTAGAPCGEALVVFETTASADLAFQRLEEDCLVLSSSKRPLIAIKVKPDEAREVARFPGHFPLDNFKLWKQRQDEVMRKAWAIAHIPEANTVEYEMAMEWCTHKMKVDICWERLYKLQRDEVGTLDRKYKKGNGVELSCS